MNIDDFRCARNGVQLAVLTQKEAALLKPINQRTGKNHRALLLLHGFSSTPAVFRYLLPAFSDYYDAVVCPVLPGHADSLTAFAEVKATDWLSSAEQACSVLLDEFAQVVVMGLSLGGLIACDLSHRFRLHHLYLLAPALDLRLNLQGCLKLAEWLQWLGFQQIRSLAGNLFTDEHCEIAYRKLPITTIIEVFNLVQSFKLSQPICPTDVFLGRHDRVVASERVAARFADNEHVSIHWLENSAHVLPLDGDIKTILACMGRNQKCD